MTSSSSADLTERELINVNIDSLSKKPNKQRSDLKAECAGCHIANVAKTDMTWVHFYPILHKGQEVRGQCERSQAAITAHHRKGGLLAAWAYGPRCPVSRGLKPCFSDLLSQAQDSFEQLPAKTALADLVSEIRHNER